MVLARRALAAAVFVGALVVGWAFASENSAPVSVSVLVGEALEVKVWVALLAAFGLGAVVCAILMLYQVAKLRLVAHRQRRVMARLEVEIHELRNLPLAAEPGTPRLEAEDDALGEAAGGAAGRSA